MELTDYAYTQDVREASHFRVTHRCQIVATQAANSRLFELRNGGSNLLILKRLFIQWLQNGTHTAAIEDSLDVFKVTGFSVADSVNNVALTPSVVRTGMFAGSAVVQGVTVAGAAAGMTGGTLAKDSGPFAQLPQWLLAAQPTAGTVVPMTLDIVPPINWNHPFGFALNEGLIIENRVLLGAAANSSVYVDCEYAEIGVR